MIYLYCKFLELKYSFLMMKTSISQNWWRANVFRPSECLSVFRIFIVSDIYANFHHIYEYNFYACGEIWNYGKYLEERITQENQL